ncbi:STN domain-containing protein, partial [Nitrincola lacisaponensis]|uniref:STN domain-containing protein n=1 Tax=Nitrincola lacisaponensis TaxID=267850 RepID=UPI0005649CB1
MLSSFDTPVAHMIRQPKRRVFRPAILSSAIHLAILGSLLLPLNTLVAQAGDASLSPVMAQHSFNIPPGSLSQVLTQFAQQTGVLLAASPAQLQGQNSPGVQGTLEIRQALSQLLAGTGLVAQLQPDG